MQDEASSPQKAFALYSVANTVTNATQSFEGFIYMRKRPAQPWEDVPFPLCIGNGSMRPRLKIAPAGGGASFEFAALDPSNQPGDLKYLKISYREGTWLFQDGGPGNPLIYNGSIQGVQVVNPMDPTQYATLYTAVATKFIHPLQPYLTMRMRMKVLAKIEVNGKLYTYGEDPEIGVETGGDH